MLIMALHSSLFICHSVAQDEYSPLFVGKIEKQYQQSRYHDNPYFGDKYDVIKGDISYNGIVYKNVPMRYDMLKQQVIVSSPTNNQLVVPEQQRVDWFTMYDQRYVHAAEDSTLYAAQLLDGSTNGLILQQISGKHVSGELIEGSHYSYTLSTSEHFSLRMLDGTVHNVKNAKDIIRLFPEQKQQIKSYVKQQHLSFTRDDRAASLTALVSYITTGYKPQTAAIQSLAIVPRQSSKAGQMQTAGTSVASSATSNSHQMTSQAAISSQGVSGTLPAGESGERGFVAGIPVLDNKEMSIAQARSGEYAASKAYVVPGVKKATQSISDDHELDEIVVVAGRQNAVKSATMGSEKFKPQLLKNIPSAFGESDIMKIVLTLPGVKTVGEASSGYNVRGGATDQNLILFNNGTVYNPSHLFGLFTSFNSDMVEDVELFKSSIPAQYGGRISSVLNVTSKEASMKKFSGSASIGLLTSKLNLEIPIVRDHVSLLLNGRTTYSDWMLKQLPEKSGYKNGTANFYDFGGVLTVKFNDYHRLKVYGYFSKDKFSFSSSDNYGYANRNISAEWRSILSEKLTATLTFGQDHYDYYNEETATPSMAARLSFGIDQLWAKLHFRHRTSSTNTLTYGLQTQHYNVQAGTYAPVGELSKISYDELQRDKALESAAYVDDEWTVNERLTLSAGFRMSMFNVLGPRDVNIYPDGELPSESNLIETRTESGVSKTYTGPEVRLSARYAINDNLSVKAGFNTMHQYIHKVSNTSIMSPTDIWKLSDRNIKPQNGWQLAAGLYAQTENKKYEFSLEGYYKHMNDYLNYRNSAVLLMNHHLETDVISTKGRAAGVELQVKKPQGRLNGWVSYCYSRTFLKQDDQRVAMPVNDGEWFPTEYDRPHEVKAVLNYKFTERYSFSGNFDYSTGRPTTVPAGQYYDRSTGAIQPFYTKRNSFRLPDYMRCDVAFNIEPTHKVTAWLHTSFSIGVYNVFARKNAYSIYYVVEDGKIQGYKLSVFGTAIPYVAFNFRF